MQNENRSFIFLKLTEIDVVALEVMHGAFGEHGIVFQLRFPQRRCVGRNQDDLGFTSAQSLNRRSEAQFVLARPHHQIQTRVDIVRRLLLGFSHCAVLLKTGSLFSMPVLKSCPSAAESLAMSTKN